MTKRAEEAFDRWYKSFSAEAWEDVDVETAFLAGFERGRASNDSFGPSIGTIVVRSNAIESADPMTGVITKVIPKKLPTGGSRWRVRVLWANGYEGVVESTSVRCI